MDNFSRYKNKETYTDEEGNTRVEFRSGKTIDVSSALALHSVKVGDVLRNISFRYYGTTKLWWAISDVNGIIDPTEDLEIGSVLVIPLRRNIGV